MKWVTFDLDGKKTSGVVIEDHVHPETQGRLLNDLLREGTEELTRAGEAAAASDSHRVELGSLTLLAPLQPPAMRDCMCFFEHIRNCMDGDLDELHTQTPAFYISNVAAVIGPYDDVRIAPNSKMWDYELEVAAVVGRDASNVRPEEAASYIAGYTIYIDWSARDIQMREMAQRLGPAKGKDTATTLGPAFVTADEFEPLRKGKGFDVGMRAYVNGRLVSDGNWSTINWDLAEVLAYASRGTTLFAGEVLGSGTVGFGCLLEHFRTESEKFRGWLQENDIVELEVDRIGRTKQRIVASEPYYQLASGF